MNTKLLGLSPLVCHAQGGVVIEGDATGGGEELPGDHRQEQYEGFPGPHRARVPDELRLEVATGGRPDIAGRLRAERWPGDAAGLGSSAPPFRLVAWRGYLASRRRSPMRVTPVVRSSSPRA